MHASKHEMQQHAEHGHGNDMHETQKGGVKFAEERTVAGSCKRAKKEAAKF